MALHSKSEFAKMCGLTTGNLTNYIKRKKVIPSGDYIDDSITDNKEFLAYRRTFVANNSAGNHRTDNLEKNLRMIQPDLQIPDPPNVEDSSDEADDIDMEGLEQATTPALMKTKLKVDIKKKIRETSILKLREQKIKGEIVPVDLIKNLFSMHTQSIITAQKDGIEELLINLSVETRLTGDQLARLRGKMVEILNNAVDKAIIITQRNMKVVVNEFAITKEVGEHE